MSDVSYERDNFSEYVLAIWKKKYLILGLSLLLAIISIILTSIEGLIREKFEVHASLYLNQPPPISGTEYNVLQTPAISFETLLVNDDLIRDVLEAYIKQYPGTRTKLELFKKRFKVTTEIAEDTNIRRKYSPVLELVTYGPTPAEAHFIMDQWVNMAIKRYGDLPAQSINFFLDYCQSNLENTQELLAVREDEYIKVKWELHSLTKILIDKENLLSPATIPMDLRRRAMDIGGSRTQQNVDVLVQSMEGINRPGLMEERARLDIEIKRLEAIEASLKELAADEEKTSDISTTGQIRKIKDALANIASPQQLDAIVAHLEYRDDTISQGRTNADMLKQTQHDLMITRKQCDAVKTAVTQLEEEIKGIQSNVTSLEMRYERLGREVEDLRNRFELVSKFKNEVESFAGVAAYQGDYPQYYRSELRLIAEPVAPELRIYPKRSVFAAVSFIIGLFLATLFVIVHKYILEISMRINISR